MKKIEVYQPWCKRCGICIAFCPKQVLEEASMGYPIATHPENCTGCNLCELRCPDCAITVYEDEGNPDENTPA